MFKWFTKGKVQRARVRAGAELLDKRVPGWAGNVDLPTLDVSSSFKCVLGQLGSRRGYGLDCYLGMVEDLGLVGSESDTVAHGFSAPWKQHGLEGEYEELTRLWRKEVLERRPV